MQRPPAPVVAAAGGRRPLVPRLGPISVELGAGGRRIATLPPPPSLAPPSLPRSRPPPPPIPPLPLGPLGTWGLTLRRTSQDPNSRLQTSRGLRNKGPRRIDLFPFAPSPLSSFSLPSCSFPFSFPRLLRSLSPVGGRPTATRTERGGNVGGCARSENRYLMDVP